jgi:hypothetical protein
MPSDLAPRDLERWWRDRDLYISSHRNTTGGARRPRQQARTEAWRSAVLVRRVARHDVQHSADCKSDRVGNANLRASGLSRALAHQGDELNFVALAR